MSHHPAKVSNAGPDANLAQAVLDSNGFREFDLWVDQQLIELVSRWEHMAAPAARHSQAVAAVRQIIKGR